jgi:hypothetical protein
MTTNSTKIADKIKTLILCYIHYFFENLYRLLDNVEKYCKPDTQRMTIWRMRIACWIPKSKNTYSEYVLHVLLLYCNNGCTNAPHCYDIRTMLVVFIIYYTVTDRYSVM